jgi:tripartite motif-containing protein 2/3
VSVFRPDGTFVTKYGSSGSGDAQLSQPLGIAISPSGVIFVCDHNNSRISVWV